MSQATHRQRFIPQWVQNTVDRYWHIAISKDNIWFITELLLIFICALSMTRPYQDLSPEYVPTGVEFYSSVQTHHFWDWAKTCGWCALWNGSVGGGSPSLADPFGSTFHPLIIGTTLIWGVIPGIKIAIVVAFFMGGIAQWWLARVLGLGRIARLWSGCMAVAGGHLAGRMELGETGMVLSTVATALVMPPLILLVRTGSRRWAVVTGVLGALAAVAGHGYLQMALILSTPLLLLLVPWDKAHILVVCRRMVLAAVLAFMLAAPFVVPYLHFLPAFNKERDLNFASVQPLQYFPLNLIINEPDYYRSTILHKLPYPWLYNNYIGWIPICLAVYALWRSRSDQERRHVRYLVAVALFALGIGSGAWMPWLADRLKGQEFINTQVLLDMLYGLRHPQQIAGLAVIALLALAAIAVDQLAQKRGHFRLALENQGGARYWMPLDLRWGLVIVLLIALMSSFRFNSGWLYMVPALSVQDRAVLEALRTPDLQWVAPPFGAHQYMEPGIETGLKIAQPIRPWSWKDRSVPQPFMEASANGAPEGMLQPPAKTVGEMAIYAAPPGREYAAIDLVDGDRVVCTAQGLGGSIDVQCDASQQGRLTVQENRSSGWYAEIDGQPSPLLDGNWLAIEVPSGQHTIAFRYRPWDVPLGLALSIVGIGMASYQWRKRDYAVRSEEPSVEPAPSYPDSDYVAAPPAEDHD